MLYNVILVSTIGRNESVIYIYIYTYIYVHIYPLLLGPPSHPTHTPPLWVITERRAELPMLYNSFPPATYVTHGSIAYWGRKWQPSPAFLPRESHGQRSLVGWCPCVCTESDATEVTWQQQQQCSVYTSILTSQFLPLSSPHPVFTCLFSASMFLFLPCK